MGRSLPAVFVAVEVNEPTFDIREALVPSGTAMEMQWVTRGGTCVPLTLTFPSAGFDNQIPLLFHELKS